MKAENEKLKGHAEHLLDYFLDLKHKYALLDPMIFDEDVVKRYGVGSNSLGFEIIRNALFFYCIQDIANIALDKNKREQGLGKTPSLEKIFSRLENQPGIVASLREQWYISGYYPPPATYEKSLEIEKFNLQYDEVKTLWEAFFQLDVLKQFETIRDKLTAHREIKFRDGRYVLTDITTLGIKWGDVKKAVNQLEPIVLGLNSIIRNAGFAMDNTNKFLERAKNEFWKV